MTLEDFFTLTEMKDGLTALGRVKELVNVMQKEKNCIVKNVGDATRQWSTVASTIAATEDKDCLDLFVQLEGLWFIDRWLKDAQKFGNDTGESFVEESITALLRALEKLHIDCKTSVSSGVWITVKDLLGHTSSRVQDRARALFDSWKQDGDSEAAPQDFQKAGNEEKPLEPQKEEMLPSTCSGDFQTENVDDCQTQTSNKESTSDHKVLKDEGSSDPVGSSIVLEPVKENSSVEEESPSYHLEGTASVETSTSVVPQQGIEEKPDIPDSNECNDESNKIPKVTSPLLGTMETSSVSLLGDDVTANAQESVTDLDLENNVDTKDKACPQVSSVCGTEADLSEGKSRRDDAESPHHQCSSTAVFKNQGQDCNTGVLSEFAGKEGKLTKQEDPQASFSSECSGATDEVKEHDSDESDDLAFDSDFSKPAMDFKRSDVIVDKSRSDLELDDLMLDPLEVARQVAIEVEREVVDRSREPSCSGSSEKTCKKGGQRDSPEGVCGKEIQPFDASSKKEVPTGPDQSAVSSPSGEDLLSSAKTLDAETEDQNQDIDSYEVTEAAAQKEPEVSAEKGFSDFDLNQELCSEDMIDRPVNPNSTTISVVSASRAAAAPGFPISPLQFEGAHGWKGSAATSAFRRILEDDKTRVTDGTQNGSKQRQDWRLDFDLNVAEAGDDNKAADLRQFKDTQIASSGLPFGESSVEANTKRHERFNLDLNHVSDDGDGPSPSSSSSSMQPALRNIDLNDQPSVQNDSSSDLVLPFFLGKSSLQMLNASRGVRSHDSVISIMGTRVEVNRKDFVPQTPSLQNGRNVNPTLDFSLGNSGGVLGVGSAFPYSGPPVFGYNGLPTGPAVTFSSAMYGPHYMVDSRGATVVPQVLGSASASPAGYSHPQFVLGMIETPPGSNGAGPSRSHFDLNSGLMFEGGNRESSSGSGGVGKRKEPDGGWEPYPFSYKHQQPPWK